MKKIIITLVAAVYAFVTYAHTHNNQSLTREEKIVAITEGKGIQGCTRWVLSLLNEHLKESGHPRRYVLKNGNLVVGTAKD